MSRISRTGYSSLARPRPDGGRRASVGATRWVARGPDGGGLTKRRWPEGGQRLSRICGLARGNLLSCPPVCRPQTRKPSPLFGHRTHSGSYSGEGRLVSAQRHGSGPDGSGKRGGRSKRAAGPDSLRSFAVHRPPQRPPARVRVPGTGLRMDTQLRLTPGRSCHEYRYMAPIVPCPWSQQLCDPAHHPESASLAVSGCPAPQQGA